MLKDLLLFSCLTTLLLITGCGSKEVCEFTYNEPYSRTMNGHNPYHFKGATLSHPKTGARLVFFSTLADWSEIYNNPFFEAAVSQDMEIADKDENRYHLVLKQDRNKNLIISHYDAGEVFGYGYTTSAEFLVDNLLNHCNDLIDQHVY